MTNNTNQNVDEDVIDLSELFFQCWRHKVSIFMATLVGALIALAITVVLIKPTYSASADIIVYNQQSNESQSTTISDIQASTSLASTYSTILKSHTILEKVIANLSLDYDYDTLSSEVSVDNVDDTQVLRITVIDTDSERALSIVREIVTAAPDALNNPLSKSSIVTVDEPWTTGEKVGPSKTKNTLIGALAGFVLSVGIVVISMLSNNKVLTENELEELLGVNVLAVVPIEDNKQAKKKKKKLRLKGNKKK